MMRAVKFLVETDGIVHYSGLSRIIAERLPIRTMCRDRVQFAFNPPDDSSVLFILLAILAILSNLDKVQFPFFDVLTVANFPLDHFPETLTIGHLFSSLDFLMFKQ